MDHEWAVLDPKSPNFRQSLRRALVEDGFFYVRSDAFVDPTLVARCFTLAAEFFQLPHSQKMDISNLKSPHFRGYTAVGAETTGGGVDFREQVDFAREYDCAPASPATVAAEPWRLLRGPNQWPARPAELRSCIQTVTAQLGSLGEFVATEMGHILELPEGSIRKLLGTEPHTRTKICRYPPSTQANGTFGVGPHKDYGLLSLLLQAEWDGRRGAAATTGSSSTAGGGRSDSTGSNGGLQAQGHDGSWVDVPPVAGTVVVNVGEMFELLSRRCFPATRHRVLPPAIVAQVAAAAAATADSGAERRRGTPALEVPGLHQSFPSRLSIPFFLNPHLDATVEPPATVPPVIVEQRRAFLRRLGRSEAADLGADPVAGNKLFPHFGTNVLKGLSRTHPRVIELHHSHLLRQRADTGGSATATAGTTTTTATTPAATTATTTATTTTSRL